MWIKAAPKRKQGTETVASLASRVKAKFPQYADMDDRELVRRLINKYPVYRKRLSDAGLEKLVMAHESEQPVFFRTIDRSFSTQPEWVPMVAPDGSIGEVPQDQVDAAVRGGGKVGVWMKAPNGSVGIIPRERVADAVKAGGKPYGSEAALRQDNQSIEPPKTLPADFFDNQKSQDGQAKSEVVGEMPLQKDWVYVALARMAKVSDKATDPAAEITVDVHNHESIKTVNADMAGAITSIQLTSGEWVHREPGTLKARLSLVSRLLVCLLYPAIGFLVPWGIIRILTWIGSGFLAPSS